MRVTSSYAVFRQGPGERGLAKARWFSREGRVADAEREYRAALAADPELRSGWLELFELLRHDGRYEEALALARRAEAQLGADAAMPLALAGAALAELGRKKEALAALEQAIERDGNLALAWHELGYAAFRAGEYSRALLALDRAFALEPHTDTLMLRGRILREAGQYDAAEVAFEGAHQSSEHDVPRREALREIAATRRAASLGRRRPRDFTARERAFAETGAVVLDDAADGTTPGAADTPLLLAAALGRFVSLAAALDWKPAACAGARPGDSELAAFLARALGAQAVGAASLDPADRPLIVTVCNAGADEWVKGLARLERWRAGYAFALTQDPGATDTADVVGTLRCAGAAAAARHVPRALELQPAPHAADDDHEILTLARNPLALWCARRRSDPAT